MLDKSPESVSSGYAFAAEKPRFSDYNPHTTARTGLGELSRSIPVLPTIRNFCPVLRSVGGSDPF
jgi:hypothetical protein